MSGTKKSFWQQYRLLLSLLIGISAGCILGVLAPEFSKALSPLGDLFLNLMFCIVVPLVFVSLSNAVGHMVSAKRLGRILGCTLLVFFGTGLVAGLIILAVVTAFPPAQGTHIALEAAELAQKQSIGSMIVDAVSVNDFPLLLSRSHMLALIVFSILFGFCVSSCGGADSPVARLLENLSRVVMKMVDLVMWYAPIGLGAYFAGLVGDLGVSILSDYGRALLIYLPLCAGYFILFFPFYAFLAGGREGVRRMLKNILPPTLTSLATQSSVATIPVNVDACRAIGVPDDVRDIVLPMGATMHMDGTVFSGILKISFLFGVFGQDFTSPGTLITALLIAIFSGVVMSGVPGGGLVGEMLIVSVYGFPPEAFPIIATIGVLVDAPATCINATGDTIAAMLVSRLVEGRNWLSRAVCSQKRS